MTNATFLLDLDNTLLGNDMNKFLPPYFALIQKRLEPLANGKDLRQILIDSVQTAITNQDPIITNMTAFMADFTGRLGYAAETLQPVLDTFYQQDYPQLRQYTTRRPEAQRAIRRLLAAGCRVVIATNPLFPATAIQQRLEWAGVSGFPYALVTTMENSHFSKPNPRYYQEILSAVKSEPESTWMVGDDPERDIAPAWKLGLKTWWITDDGGTPEQSPTPPCDEYGSLADFLASIEAGQLLA